MNEYQILNDSHPPFLVKLMQFVAKSWTSLGSVACKFNKISEGYYEVMFFPALREVYGGKSDGNCVYPGFNFNVSRFVNSFDKSPRPKVVYDALCSDSISHLLFKGYLDGICLKVSIMSEPPCGQKAIERVHATGPKQGQVEPIIRG